MSLAKQIGIELAARIAQISIANGYLTDVGLTVFRGRRQLAPEQLPCATLVEGPDSVQDRRLREVKVAQRYVLEAHDHCDVDNPNDKAHDIIADLKRAIFGSDTTLGRKVKEIEYVGRTIGSRDDGADLVFGAVEIDVVFHEDLTNP